MQLTTLYKNDVNYCNKLLVLQYIKGNYLVVHHNYLHDLRMFYCATCFIISFSPNQHLFTHREPFRWFYTLSIFLSQGVKFFCKCPMRWAKENTERKRGKNIPLTQEIGTSCATAQCNHLSHLSISCPLALPFTSSNKWWSHVHFVFQYTITDLYGQLE